ncbi:MAG TPA: phage holin family protein [Polyangia bacterium]
MAPRYGETDEREGIVGLVRETVEGLRTLIVDHIKLARVELATDLKSYGRSVAVLAGAGAVLAVGYLFAWIAAALAIGRLIGAPLGFVVIGGFHLLVGGFAIGWAMGKVRRTRLMNDTVAETKTSARTLAQSVQRQALEGRP